MMVQKNECFDTAYTESKHWLATTVMHLGIACDMQHNGVHS